MAEMYPSDAALNALSGTNDPEQEVLYLPIGQSPYYTSFYRMQHRLLSVARRAGDFRVFKDGDLSFGVRGGRLADGGSEAVFAGASNVSLTNNAINHVYLDGTAHVVVSTTGFPSPATTPHLPLAIIGAGSESAGGVSGQYSLDDVVDVRGEGMFRVRSGLSAALANETAAFFGATDITGAEAQTLTEGALADGLHRHESSGVSNLLGNAFAQAQAVNVTAGGFTIAHNHRAVVTLSATGAWTSSATVAIADGGVVGQRLTIFRPAAGPQVTICNAANTRLNGDWKRDSQGALLELVWDGNDWCELSRSDFQGGVGAASGILSCAQGAGTTASGYASHAEGLTTTASGSQSHAQGAGTTASGVSSHAGGDCTVAASDYSTAMGSHSQTRLVSQLSHASGCFVAAGDAQYTRAILRGDSADQTPVELTLNGSTPSSAGRYGIDTGRTCGIRLTVTGRQTTGQSAFFVRQLLIRRVSNTVDLVGAVQTIGTDINPAGWSLTVQADNVNKSLQVLVTGAAASSIRWVATVESTEVVN